MSQFAFRTAATILFWSLTVGAGPALAQDTVLEILFDAPHRSADSLWEMPDIGPTEKPFTAALAAVVAGDLAQARTHADAAGYEIVEKTEDGLGYAILFEKSRAGIGPTIAVALNPVRDAVIQAPHPVIDRYTNRQAAVLFLRLGALQRPDTGLRGRSQPVPDLRSGAQHGNAVPHGASLFLRRLAAVHCRAAAWLPQSR